MQRNRNSEVFGIFLAILGVLFLLVNNNLVWFGWDALWPLVPFLIGVIMLRDYRARRNPRQLFRGTLLVQFGVFFFLFSSGIFSWDLMQKLWPTIPLIIGISLFVLSAAGVEAPPIIFGVVLVVFAIVSYLAYSDVIEPRISEPFVRIWPLALVAAGALIYLRGKRERLERTESPAGGGAPASDTQESDKNQA
jgi:hypothetical protein